MGKCLIIKGADFSSVAAAHVEILPPKVVISVVASPAGGGSTTGTGSYDEGQNVEISAIPASGYTFLQWSDGNQNSTRTIVVGSSSKTYTAIFFTPIELINHLNGVYLNGSGVVSGEGQSAFEEYQVKFYKVTANSVRITCSNSGAGGVGVSSWVLYSGIDENNQGVGLIQKANPAVGSSYDDVIDTSVNKYIGISYRTTQDYTEPVITKVS